ncbi:MAG: phosphatidylserine decarboxylase family protein [Syntrophomonadaceae bacterium]|nr:phosphatidylserine decarboxylase family protein [Syntrophomonadaceae bacterium]
MKNAPIVPDAWLYLFILGTITVVTFIFYSYLALIPLILFLFIGFFFRNPQRKIPEQPALIISPADGLVMSVETVKEERYLHSEAIKVSIFLNIFNVHVNRAPIAGKVEYQEYRSGKFLPAYKSEAAAVNEQNLLGLKNNDFKVLVIQIAGLVARRVVSWVKPGDFLEQGERFGLIKFGSCTELYLPLKVKIEVKKGDRVRGGETIIGRVIG